MYLSIKGKAINVFYVLEWVCDSSHTVVGCELLTSIKYRNYNDHIDPKEYLKYVNRRDGVNVLRSQIKTAIKLLASNKEISFILISINKNLIDCILSDHILLGLLKKNSNSIIFELSEEIKSDSISKVNDLSKYCQLWLGRFGEHNCKEKIKLMPFISGVKICGQLLQTLDSLDCGPFTLTSIVNELKQDCQKVIIEGIESERLYAMAKACNLDLYQGCFFGFRYLGMAE